jgi:hypothetical protein
MLRKNRKESSVNRTIVAAGLGATGAFVLFLATAASSDARPPCARVSGTYVEHAVGGPGCTSTVGLCIAGQYTSGRLRGTFEGAATSITSTVDTPTTAVSLFTSTSRITASLRGRSGSLLIRNAGAFSSTPGGPIVDIQTIVGGTDGFTGASGSLRASGTFSLANGGASTYVGSVCLPPLATS